jgi:hypothetical protein
MRARVVKQRNLYLVSLGTVKRSFFSTCLNGMRLGHGDGVDEEADSALGNDVRDGVSDLNEHHRLAARKADHGENVHYRVGAPRDHCRPLCLLDQATDIGVRLRFRRGSEANEQGVHNVEKRKHGEEPVQPAGIKVRLLKDEFTRVAEDDHEGSCSAKSDALRARLFSTEVHDKDYFDEEERYGQEPIHVTVSIVERPASCGKHAFRIVLVRFIPGVEYAEVVVRSNEGNKASDDDSALVLLVNGGLSVVGTRGGVWVRRGIDLLFTVKAKNTN